MARSLSRRLRDFGEAEPQGFDLENVPSAGIVLYFADQPEKLHQLLQWLPMFENHTELRTIVVVRNLESYNESRTRTLLNVLLVPNYETLMALYDRADFQAVIFDILGILTETDLLIANDSSVTPEYLYLRPLTPIMLIDCEPNPAQLLADSPCVPRAPLLIRIAFRFGGLITTTLDADAHRDDRARMRTYYFGDTAKGRSTQAFWSAIASEIAV